MKSYQVVWKGPIHRASGLGIASRGYVRGLRRQGVDVRTRGAWNGITRSGKRSQYNILIYHYLPHTLDIKKARKHFDYILLNTVWETTQIPMSWRSNINRFDAVCVPSLQNEQALRKSGVKVPIYIVPHGVDSVTFSPKNKKLPIGGTSGRFVFVSVFGFQHRKNPEALLRAYWEEFSSADKVLLVIKTSGYASYENEQWIKNRILQYKNRLGIRKSTAPVKVIARHIDPRKLKGIYTLGNAFVLPTRGEGVGLPFLESLASGTPVITTGWGGHMDFLTRRNSFFVKYKLQSPLSSMNRNSSISRHFRWLFAGRGQMWAEADIRSLRNQMRLAYQNPQLCKMKGRQGRLDTLKYSWTRSGRSMHSVIMKVIRRPARK